jgi:hypothetical protein
MKAFRYLLIFGLLGRFNTSYAQDNLIKTKIYSDFITQSVYIHDSTFKKKSELIIISDIKKFDLGANLDIESLNDYLTGKTESNKLFRLIEEKYNQKPIDYFYQIPWRNFGNLLSRDSTFGFLILKLDNLLKKKYKLKNIENIKTNYKLKYTRGNIPHGSDSWDKFYKKNQSCFGIIKLSDILIGSNNKVAVFYSESYHYSLIASGDLVFMELTENGWRILEYINIWIS